FFQAAAQLAERPPGVAHDREDTQRGNQAVSGRGHVRAHDVAARLAAEFGAVGAHALDDVAVSHRGAHHAAACRGHGDVDAQIALHGHDKLVHREFATPQRVDRQQRQDFVAVEHLAIFVAEDAPVAIAVVRDPDASAGFADARGHLLGMLAADAVVDVAAVRRLPERDDLGTEPTEYPWTGYTGGTVCRIEHD